MLLLDIAGNTTLVVGQNPVPAVASVQAAISIGVITGNLVTNVWNRMQVISGTDPADRFVANENVSGAAVIAYFSNWNTPNPYSVHAVTRANTGAAWSSPANLDSSLADYYFGNIAINESGQAALTYSGDNAALTYSAVRVIEYQP